MYVLSQYLVCQLLLQGVLDHLVRFQMVSQDTVSWLNHLVRIQIKRLSLCLLSYCIVFNHSSVTV